MAEIRVHTERVDDIPLLFHHLERMGIAEIINWVIHPHGNRRGLSPGYLVTVWLIHILSEADHRMYVVEGWAQEHLQTLAGLLPEAVKVKDFTDDRLADILRTLSDDDLWQEIEKSLTERLIVVYRLQRKTVRTDSTVVSVYHDSQEGTIFQVGYNREHPGLAQFKLELSSLDPLGLPVATLVAAGNEADDGLYKPVISRTREALGEKGLLYVGDAKMAALSIRAFIHQGGDYYLVPLPLVGKVPERLEELLKRVRNRKLPLELVYREGDKKKLIALVCEVTADCRLHTEEEISWQERQLLVYSISLARKQRQGLEKRLKAAEGELRRLTLPGKGHRRWREKRALEERIKKILNKHRVKGLLRVEVLERVEVRKVRGYGGKPGREEREVWYEVKVERDEEAIGEARRRMGWRLYATNAPGELLSAEEVVLVHREAHRIERDFRRLKGKPLGLSPLYVIREDHTKGMVRLLTLALRALVLVEFEARRRLEERGEEMEGLYPGQPKRSTPRPTAEKLLRAFRNITLSMIKLPGETVCHITPLNEVQLRILELLALPPSIYENLARAALSNPP